MWSFFQSKGGFTFRGGGLETCSPGHSVNLINLIEYMIFLQRKRCKLVQTCVFIICLCVHVRACICTIFWTKCIGKKCNLKKKNSNEENLSTNIVHKYKKIYASNMPCTNFSCFDLFIKLLLFHVGSYITERAITSPSVHNTEMKRKWYNSHLQYLCQSAYWELNIPFACAQKGFLTQI